MDAQSAFAEILEKLPRQHLRTRFRSRFGTETSEFGEDSFARGSVRAALDRRLDHLLQEASEGLVAYVLTGPADALRAVRLDPAPDATLSVLFGAGDAERVLVVHGRTARLYAHLAPGAEEAWVRRLALPKEDRPDTKPRAPVLSRRARAALAGKTKHVKKPPRRR